MDRVSTAVSAPIRTGFQFVVASALVELLDSFVDVTDRQYLALVGILTLLVTAVQHLAENRMGKAILRDVPPTTAPVVAE